MSQTSRLSLLAGAAVVFGAGGSAMAQQAQAWSNTDEVRALVSEMMSDAETRSSLLAGGGTAGHDGKFFLASADGNFRLNVSGYAQFRYYLNFRDDAHATTDPPTAAEDDFESGFQTTRTKLIFDGHVYDPNLFYYIQAAFDRGGDGSFNLEDAYVGYKWDNGWSAQWGQFKLPFLREELVSETYQLAADHSLTTEVFTLRRSQGVQLGYADENWRMAVAFSDGGNSANSDFASKRGQANGFLGGGESDYAFTARAEFKFAGAWEQFKDFTSKSGSDFAFMLGAAAHYEYGDRTASAFSSSWYNSGAATVDLSFEGDGWNLFVAGIGNWSNFNNVAATGGDIGNDDYGAEIQGGIMIPNSDWEIFARYDILFADDANRGLNSNDSDFSSVTAGVNYYMHGHGAKFTADFIWFIDDVNALNASPNTQIGYLTDDDQNEVTLRFQFQLMF